MGKADRSREYQPGDKVRRKSDGQPMTVEEVYPPHYYYRLRCGSGTGPDKKSDLYRLSEVEPDPPE